MWERKKKEKFLGTRNKEETKNQSYKWGGKIELNKIGHSSW